MSQLYFTSSLLQNKRFLNLEDLFNDFNSSNTVFVLDTNVVIYIRELYYNSKKFIENKENTRIYNSIRYLINGINRYNLQVDATIGIDESSRRIEDFLINMEKAQQTRKAILTIFEMNLDEFDSHINNNFTEKVITLENKYSISKIPHLKQESIFQNILTISYLCSLKIILLNEEINANKLSPIEAYINLHNYMTNEIDCVGGSILIYAMHLFGGDEEFKRILYCKKNSPKGKRLHQIFNGSVDLIFPYITRCAFRRC